MNGELHHACRLTVAAKHSLREEAFFCEASPYEKELEFQFQDGVTAASGAEWMQGLQMRGLQDVLLLSPAVVHDLNLLAFVGGAQFCIACFYAAGTVSVWFADWEYDKFIEGWRIRYQERSWPEAPKGKPVFFDPTGEFVKVLAEIGRLAERIDEPGFARCFAKAGAALIEAEPPCRLPIRLPERHARLFAAAGDAWVFGGMGSWNDSPPYEAHEMGLDKEYEQLSSALHSQIMRAVLYAVNEW